jgi:hypothetical protein
MNLLRFPNFIFCEEAQEMSSWVLQNKNKEFFQDANMKGNRITTRYSTNKEFMYPKLIGKIRNRIIDVLNLYEEENNGIYPPFKNGVVASCAFPGDTCYEHIDPVWHQGFNTLHCNVITQSPDKGGNLILNGIIEPMSELELCCYLVSRTAHSTTLIEGNKERIMWVFGFCIDNEKWEALIEKHQRLYSGVGKCNDTLSL